MTTHKLADTENMASRCKANKLVRMIRFIDPEYNTLFSIPDGSSIVMIWMNGNKKLRQCSYVDDLHAKIDGAVTYLHRFAWFSQKAGVIYEPADRTLLPAESGHYEIYQIEQLDKVECTFTESGRPQVTLRGVNYRKAFAAMLAPCVTIDDLYQQHSVDRRFDIQKLKMVSASDVFVLKRRSGEKAYYVDAAGIHEIPNFLQKYKYVQPHGE